MKSKADYFFFFFFLVIQKWVSLSIKHDNSEEPAYLIAGIAWAYCAFFLYRKARKLILLFINQVEFYLKESVKNGPKR